MDMENDLLATIEYMTIVYSLVDERAATLRRGPQTDTDIDIELGTLRVIGEALDHAKAARALWGRLTGTAEPADD
ncbi:hypothetical protein A33M_2902 [Rhodovulum sp. PH10]|uniref:hypothetical protein n=1 Tax=Rhodovulum sp. PH10 TaxID=1187851 RepID=UPI00027C2A5E|nr:hypothetical protein [Rhodovulum sp. PH10]EJW11705.1 hypothetical protein A33M_2902 [Rhodovulum sp. PH10]